MNHDKISDDDEDNKQNDDNQIVSKSTYNIRLADRTRSHLSGYYKMVSH